MDPTFTFESELVPWNADKSTWVFAQLPIDDAEEIRDIAPDRKGFGSLKVRCRIGEVEWSTSIFPDSTSGSFVLPVKKQVRKDVGVDIGDVVQIELDVLIT
jgi:hypothetical protein